MATSPYVIGGSLNFGGGSGSDYNSAYQNALSINQQNYGNILSGYQGLAQQQYAAQQGVQQGYNQLTSDVLSGIQNVGSDQLQAINDQYAKASGGASQSMINSGLGNTTAQAAVQRGLLLDRSKSTNNLANQIAQLKAGYQSNLGSQALGYGASAIQQNTALGQNQLAWMNSVNAPYPNPQSYMNLAAMRGANRAGLAGNGTGVRQSGVPGLSDAGGQGMMAARGFAPSMGYMSGYNPSAYTGSTGSSTNAQTAASASQITPYQDYLGGYSSSGGDFGSEDPYADVGQWDTGVPAYSMADAGTNEDVNQAENDFMGASDYGDF